MDGPAERHGQPRLRTAPAAHRNVASAFRITLLDGFTLRPRPSGRGLPRGVQRLVAHLCLAGRPARTAIAGSLWPEVPEDQAHANLRSALWRVCKAVPGLVEREGDALSLAHRVGVDVWDLQEWAARVTDPHTHLVEVSPLDDALRGELLPGWYDDWVLLERERLRQLRMHALEALADRLTGARRFGEALQAACLAVRAEPLRESAHRTLVRVHLAEGNLVEAQRAYGFFRQLLEDELGVPPSEQMNRLIAGIGRPPRVASCCSCPAAYLTGPRILPAR
jgi:DNA-binding SARP family transcriptional activator